MQYLFGAGNFFGVPLQDASGNAITNGTPIQIGVMQEMSLEFSSDVKELHGQNQFAVDVGRGKGKVGGKIKGAQISGQAINSLYFGQVQTAGTSTQILVDSTGSVVPATPFAITVTPPSAGTFAEDMGVRNSDGLPMVKVASGPITGQYSQAGAVYTFAAADTAKTMFINYRYTFVSAAAKKITVNNLAMGAAPLIRALMQVDYRGKRALVVLPNGLFTKLSMFGTKLDDYSIPEFDFSAFADGAGLVAEIHVSE